MTTSTTPQLLEQRVSKKKKRQKPMSGCKSNRKKFKSDGKVVNSKMDNDEKTYSLVGDVKENVMKDLEKKTETNDTINNSAIKLLENISNEKNEDNVSNGIENLANNSDNEKIKNKDDQINLSFLENLKVFELKVECRKRQLSVSGNKHVLLMRLLPYSNVIIQQYQQPKTDSSLNQNKPQNTHQKSTSQTFQTAPKDQQQQQQAHNSEGQLNETNETKNFQIVSSTPSQCSRSDNPNSEISLSFVQSSFSKDSLSFKTQPKTEQICNLVSSESPPCFSKLLETSSINKVSSCYTQVNNILRLPKVETSEVITIVTPRQNYGLFNARNNTNNNIVRLKNIENKIEKVITKLENGLIENQPVFSDKLDLNIKNNYKNVSCQQMNNIKKIEDLWKNKTNNQSLRKMIEILLNNVEAMKNKQENSYMNAKVLNQSILKYLSLLNYTPDPIADETNKQTNNSTLNQITLLNNLNYNSISNFLWLQQQKDLITIHRDLCNMQQKLIQARGLVFNTEFFKEHFYSLNNANKSPLQVNNVFGNLPSQSNHADAGCKKFEKIFETITNKNFLNEPKIVKNHNNDLMESEKALLNNKIFENGVIESKENNLSRIKSSFNKDLAHIYNQVTSNSSKISPLIQNFSENKIELSNEYSSNKTNEHEENAKIENRDIYKNQLIFDHKYPTQVTEDCINDRFLNQNMNNYKSTDQNFNETSSKNQNFFEKKDNNHCGIFENVDGKKVCLKKLPFIKGLDSTIYCNKTQIKSNEPFLKQKIRCLSTKFISKSDASKENNSNTHVSCGNNIEENINSTHEESSKSFSARQTNYFCKFSDRNTRKENFSSTPMQSIEYDKEISINKNIHSSFNSSFCLQTTSTQSGINLNLKNQTISKTDNNSINNNNLKCFSEYIYDAYCNKIIDEISEKKLETILEKTQSLLNRDIKSHQNSEFSKNFINGKLTFSSLNEDCSYGSVKADSMKHHESGRKEFLIGSNITPNASETKPFSGFSMPSDCKSDDFVTLSTFSTPSTVQDVNIFNGAGANNIRNIAQNKIFETESRNKIHEKSEEDIYDDVDCDFLNELSLLTIPYYSQLADFNEIYNEKHSEIFEIDSLNYLKNSSTHIHRAKKLTDNERLSQNNESFRNQSENDVKI